MRAIVISLLAALAVSAAWPLPVSVNGAPWKTWTDAELRALTYPLPPAPAASTPRRGVSLHEILPLMQSASRLEVSGTRGVSVFEGESLADSLVVLVPRRHGVGLAARRGRPGGRGGTLPRALGRTARGHEAPGVGELGRRRPAQGGDRTLRRAARLLHLGPRRAAGRIEAGRRHPGRGRAARRGHGPVRLPADAHRGEGPAAARLAPARPHHPEGTGRLPAGGIAVGSTVLVRHPARLLQ